MSALLITGSRALFKEIVLTPRGKRHEPGTWTRGHRLTEKKVIIFLGLRQRDFMLVRKGKNTDGM
jgi:hypothetical protein